MYRKREKRASAKMTTMGIEKRGPGKEGTGLENWIQEGTKEKVGFREMTPNFQV